MTSNGLSIWRLLYVAPGAERKVIAAMAERGLTGYAPWETVWRGLSVRRRKMTRALVPRYVFARLDDYDIPAVARLHGVQRFVGNNGPCAVPQAFIAALMIAEANGEYDHTRSVTLSFAKGQSVRIARGPFQGIAATIVKLTTTRRAQVITQLFGHARPLTIDVAHLEMAA